MASGCEQQAEAPEEAVATDIPEELQQDALVEQYLFDTFAIGSEQAEAVRVAIKPHQM